MLKQIVMIVGYYTIITYLIGTIGLLLYWWIFRREARKRTREPGWDKGAARLIMGLGVLWWGASPYTVPQWIIGRLIIEQLRKLSKRGSSPS